MDGVRGVIIMAIDEDITTGIAMVTTEVIVRVQRQVTGQGSAAAPQTMFITTGIVE